MLVETDQARIGHADQTLISRCIMLKDHNHDLVHALSEKNDALWRYKKEYKRNAKGCRHCASLWQRLESDDDRHVKLILAEIKRHSDEKRFN